MRNIFHEKSYTKCGGKASLRSYLKKSKLNIYLDQQSEILYRLFLLYVQVEIYKNILKVRYWPFAFTLFEAFFTRQIEVWNQYPYLIFSLIFEDKYFSRCILSTHYISWPHCLQFLRCRGIFVLHCNYLFASL